MLQSDFEQFWRDDEIAHKENCFFEDSPQVALGIRMSEECVFAELSEEGNPWGVTPIERRVELNKRYNDKAEEIVGKRFLPEAIEEVPKEFYLIKRIGEVFGGEYTLSESAGEWLHSNINSPEGLEKQLDIVEKTDLRTFMFPDNWELIKKEVYERTGKKPLALRHIRGPVTLATSIYGIENLTYLYYDEPELFERFSCLIGDVIIKMADIMDEEAGESPRGFLFADDDCAMMTCEMYEKFGYPVLKRVFEKYSPNENDSRYQHSDSDMGHLIPILSKLNLTGCNFGPNIMVGDIRKYMPKTRIDGCIAPFVFMNNDRDEIERQAKRDCEAIKETGTKGLNLTTAGSINNGSSLESLRLVMECILKYGRY